MLFCNIAYGHRPPDAVRDRVAKDAFSKKNSIRMMSQAAMSEVGHQTLRLIKLIMNGQIVFYSAPKFQRT